MHETIKFPCTYRCYTISKRISALVVLLRSCQAGHLKSYRFGQSLTTILLTVSITNTIVVWYRVNYHYCLSVYVTYVRIVIVTVHYTTLSNENYFLKMNLIIGQGGRCWLGKGKKWVNLRSIGKSGDQFRRHPVWGTN